MLAATLVAAIGVALPSFAQDDYTAPPTELANGKLREIAQDPALVNAIIAQNQQTAGYDAAKVDELDKQWRAALGVDNLNNRQYFLYHPFPQRTAFAELKYDF